MKIFITGASALESFSKIALMSIFVFRTTASTNMNDTSSRSHAIFTIVFTQVNYTRALVVYNLIIILILAHLLLSRDILDGTV